MTLPALPADNANWKAWATALDAEARTIADKVDDTDPRLADARTPTDGSVTNAKVASGAAISADKLADGTTGKILTATERTKLAGVATGATANSTDATLLARANHTGAQAISTVTGLQTALDAKTALTVDGAFQATYNISTTAITKADVGLGNVDNTSDVNKPVSTAQQTAIDALKVVTANTQTGTTYTLVLTDALKAVEMNNASASTLTIPLNSSVAFPVGTVIEVFQLGAGQTTVTATGGVTLRAPDGAKTAKQYASASLRKRATDEWVLAGNTSV